MRVTVSGTILADSFGRVPDSEYVYGDLADLGWKVRWSAPLDRLEHGIIDTVEGGSNVEVVIVGNLEAALKRSDAVLKLKAISVSLPSKANGVASTWKPSETADA